MKSTRFHKFILDLLFPIHCINCNEHGSWLCDKCCAKILINNEHVCPVCEKRPTPDGRVCFSCKNKSSLDAIVTATQYSPLLKKIVHYHKYRFINDVSRPLGNIMAKSLLNINLIIPDFIIPVPLHPRRLRWRGFNQSQLLARAISDKIAPPLQVPILKNCLIRNRYTFPQMEIKQYKQRQANISEAFACLDPKAIKGKSILLVDDICTTGSTLFECAKVLKQNEAAFVWAIVIARQSIREEEK